MLVYRQLPQSGNLQICFYSMAKNQHFALCRKNYALDQKMVDTSQDRHDVLYHHAKFGEIEQRLLAVGVMWCLYVYIFCHTWSAGALFIRGDIL